MATWAKVEKFIKQKYVVSEQDGKWLFLDFELDNGRAQRVMVTTTGDLIQFLSPFATLGEVDITQVLSAMRTAAIPLGITGVDDLLLVTHSQLLETADEEEIHLGIGLVTEAADILEGQLSSRDRF